MIITIKQQNFINRILTHKITKSPTHTQLLDSYTWQEIIGMTIYTLFDTFYFSKNDLNIIKLGINCINCIDIDTASTLINRLLNNPNLQIVFNSNYISIFYNNETQIYFIDNICQESYSKTQILNY